MKKLFSCIIITCCLSTLVSAQAISPQLNMKKPKLVVGIVVDQMRYDLLWRFWDLYGEGGFKRLVNEGFLCENARYNYFLTVTAAGHSTIYTGTTPSIHGVVENNFYDRALRKSVYMMNDNPDTTIRTVGNPTAERGPSPFRLMSTTMTDELKLASKDSRVYGVAQKDRSAMMPAGHLADGAFYFDLKTGNWITTTWYTRNKPNYKLPDYLTQFNRTRDANNYLNKDWELLLPRSAYTMCTGDTTRYEHKTKDETYPVFPHKMKRNDFHSIIGSPFGNTMTKDIAIQVLKNEKLGKRDATDFLCISFSSTDYVQHAYGPSSLEVADCYARLDRDLEALLKYLDEQVGKENVLVFLTADHGGALNPMFAEDHNIVGGRMKADDMVPMANGYLSKYFGKGDWVAAMMSQQVYLNIPAIDSAGLKEDEVARKTVDFLMAQPGVMCVTSPKYNINLCPPHVQTDVLNGYYPDRSGDIFYSMKAGWIDWIYDEGTSHGTVFDYDQHVPLLWYGWHVQHGATADRIGIIDIAPTICNWLNITNPSGCLGNPITEIPLK